MKLIAEYKQAGPSFFIPVATPQDAEPTATLPDRNEEEFESNHNNIDEMIDACDQYWAEELLMMQD